jgi:hypothetical protein
MAHTISSLAAEVGRDLAAGAERGVKRILAALADVHAFDHVTL